jgi:hypothetical protein
MGIVLKRRDNAEIVKEVYGGIINTILNKEDILGSAAFLKESLSKLVRGEYSMDKLIVSKTLRAMYKSPRSIAHKVLADRMYERDPGSAPAVNDRVQYVYIETKAPTGKGKKQVVLQGDRIEDPGFIVENKLQVDYGHYITNQIMKPCLQLYALPGVLEKLPGYRAVDYTIMYQRLLLQKGDVLKAQARLDVVREEHAKQLLFSDALYELENKRSGMRSIVDYFSAASKKKN